ncbi:MAG: hypothetical protein J3K34DRAFT_409441 [Monoraphidium minutum]|nr:MAG: hypothetical protein J3K34DRAFT_409441 [Monoraphidium minutum]
MMLRCKAPLSAANGASTRQRAAPVRASAHSNKHEGPAALDAVAAALRPATRALSSALLAASLFVTPAAALADEAPVAGSKAPADTVYFGNGCFWGRQKDFVEAEKALGRTSPDQISSLVGYAAGKKAGPGGKVCYYYSDPRTTYEKLGHAEVVQVALTPGEEAQQEAEFRRFADTYFSQFQRLRNGRMQRLDPQDFGPGYRNVVGLPGGVSSPLFKVLQDANVNRMELREGSGNAYEGGGIGARPTEGDELGVVWVVDSGSLPFYRAERYHQFHPGLGMESFPASYTRDLKAAVAATGKIDPTGCPELPF